MSSSTTSITTSSKSSCRTNLEEYLEALLGFDDVSALLDHLLLLSRLEARSYLLDLMGSIKNNHDTKKNNTIESFLDKMQDYQSGVRPVPPMYGFTSPKDNANSTNKPSGSSNFDNGSTKELHLNIPRVKASGSSTINTHHAKVSCFESQSQLQPKIIDQTATRPAGSTTTRSNLSLQSKRYNGPEGTVKKKVVQPTTAKKKGSSVIARTAVAAAANGTSKTSTVTSRTADDNSTNDQDNKRLSMVQNRQEIRVTSRKECGCYGTVHDCYTNCLDCGRIACVEEGYGECFFCGSFLDSDKNNTMDTSTNSTNNNNNFLRNVVTKVEREKQQWLQRDREFAQRTVVLDDDQVVPSGDSFWLDNQERMKVQAAEDQRRNELHSKKKEIQMTVNF